MTREVAQAALPAGWMACLLVAVALARSKLQLAPMGTDL